MLIIYSPTYDTGVVRRNAVRSFLQTFEAELKARSVEEIFSVIYSQIVNVEVLDFLLDFYVFSWEEGNVLLR